ncbi:hypothetical protein MKW98_028156 [Papaver atlanticum]|uniref:Uncharacterized protein n=1 Tax=Papaver atlanticum TaxID=357466 RepID=A0AAD4XMJ5_9MAGN|nr:hypothetical protein MKW98_028156 [Papaver atlanticum]
MEEDSTPDRAEIEEIATPDGEENLEPNEEDNLEYMDGSLQQHIAGDLAENSTPDRDVYSTPSMDLIDALIDIPPRELERPVQISLVPSYVKKRNPDAYQPKMVSIGPYHYGKPQLQPMQSHKNRAVNHFLRRSPNMATKQQYVDALMLVYDQLWRSYEQVNQLGNWTRAGFIKLMMIDGIFLLEFLNVLHGNGNDNDYADSDPIFGKRGHVLNYNHVMDDLLLLENQVPYLVLSTLLTVSQGSATEEMENYLGRLMLAPAAIKGHHLLDVYSKGTLGRSERQDPVMGEGATKVSAAELTKTCGMVFKAIATYSDMKFRRRAKTLELPTIIIDKGTIHRFNNLKAYQLLTGDTSMELISYIHLLNFFILSVVDVNTLRSQGIIVSSLDSDEAIVTVMKEIMRDTMAENIDEKSAGIIKLVRKFYDHKSFVYYCFAWFTTRWRLVITVLGSTLFILNFVESVYSIRHYRDH